MSDFEDAVESCIRRYRRTVRRIVTEPQKATITITLGCGHEVPMHVADHPVLAITDIYGIELGDEVNCPFCHELASP